MTRIVVLMGLVAAAASASPRADQKGKVPAAPKAAAKAAMPKGGTPKGAAKMGPRMTNPTSPASRLYQLNPAERERALEKLPQEQQDRIRQNLKWFDGLPKDQQTMVVRRAERFAALPPEERRAVQQQMQALNRLPQERRAAVGGALRRLQGLSDEQRLELFNRPAFRNRFSPEELRIMGKLSEVMPPPM